MQRREFIIKGTTGGLAASTFPNIILAKKHKVYSVALIGSGWWGMNILSTAIASGTVKPIALCDVDQAQLDKSLSKVNELTGKKPNLYKDYREMLEAGKTGHCYHCDTGSLACLPSNQSPGDRMPCIS
jgi:hypothetical protein